MRYIEANPIRAQIVQDAADWPWSSYALRQGRPSVLNLSRGPVALPADWTQWVHGDIDEKSHQTLQNSINRSYPLGEPEWMLKTAKIMGLESTLRRKGRPKKVPDIVSFTHWADLSRQPQSRKNRSVILSRKLDQIPESRPEICSLIELRCDRFKANQLQEQVVQRLFRRR